jgi:hypothetical protein
MTMLIGLLLTRNEEDIIKEVMEEYSKHFDAILVFDSSTDDTPEIIRTFSKVEYMTNDRETRIPNRYIKDGVRHLLLKKAQEMYGYEGWFFSLQGDEIFHGDLRKYVHIIDGEGNRGNCLVAYFVMHESERESIYKEDVNLPIQSRRLYYFLTFPENCCYRNEVGLWFNPMEHMRVIPYGSSPPAFASTMIVRKHYPMRTPAQWEERVRDRVKRGWQPNYKDIPTFISNPEQIHRTGPVYTQIKHFDGSFKVPEYDFGWRLIE